MRMRIIKPGFFTNDRLAELHPLTRILFIGLWCLADREGKLIERLKKVKVQVLPYDDIDIESALDDLEKAGFIIRYRFQNRSAEKYIKIINFESHQRPNVKESPSTIPEPSRHRSRRVPAPFQKNTYQEQEQEQEQEQICKVRSAPAGRTTDGFDVLWEARPRRSGGDSKQRAFRAYRARLAQGVSPDALLDGIQRYASWCIISGKAGTEYVMQTATFLGPDRRWEELWNNNSESGWNVGVFKS